MFQAIILAVKQHKAEVDNFPLMDFILSYRKAAYGSEVKDKQSSVELLKVFFSFSSWKPLNVSKVAIISEIDYILLLLFIA